MTRALLSIVLAGLLIASPAAYATPDWSYMGGANNDEGWGELSPDFAACDIGTGQSPVVIGYTTVSDLPPLTFDYADMAAHMDSKEHTLLITLDGKSALTVGDRHYRLTQIRFHTPSEHVVLGRVYPLEIHLIHQDDQGKTLIVAVFVEFGEANAAMQSILTNIAAHSHDLTLNAAPFLPGAAAKNGGYYAYTGSLSWPPCTEGVEWRVMKKTVSISLPQFQQLANILPRNARLPQPLYLRTILESRD